jgi:hypothetical protein
MTPPPPLPIAHAKLHVQLAVERALSAGVPGDLIEAGVFRGGGTIFMRAVLAAHELSNGGAVGGSAAGRGLGGGAGGQRRVFVADSFEGIPPSRRAVVDGLQEECDLWEERYAVSEEEVRGGLRLCPESRNNCLLLLHHLHFLNTTKNFNIIFSFSPNVRSMAEGAIQLPALRLAG